MSKVDRGSGGVCRQRLYAKYGQRNYGDHEYRIHDHISYLIIDVFKLKIAFPQKQGLECILLIVFCHMFLMNHTKK